MSMSWMMRSLSLILLLSTWTGLSQAKVSEVPLEVLNQDGRHRQAALIVTNVVDRFHYRKLPLDDHMSAQILDRYIESLDPNRSFFSAQDMAAFDAYREETLRRLEEEQQDFEAFLQRLREARDKAEFDQFIDERAAKSDHATDETEEKPA